MASRSFAKTSANRAFGQFKESNTAGDYVLNKKAKTTFCGANMCTPSIKVNTQENLLLLRRSNKLKYYNCLYSFNKANLNINLLTKLNVNKVVVLTQPINTTPFYSFLNFILDPDGTLLGTDTCNINNYTSYMVYNPPNSFKVPNPTLTPIVPTPPYPIPKLNPI